MRFQREGKCGQSSVRSSIRWLVICIVVCPNSCVTHFIELAAREYLELTDMWCILCELQSIYWVFFGFKIDSGVRVPKTQTGGSVIQKKTFWTVIRECFNFCYWRYFDYSLHRNFQNRMWPVIHTEVLRSVNKHPQDSLIVQWTIFHPSLDQYMQNEPISFDEEPEELFICLFTLFTTATLTRTLSELLCCRTCTTISGI